VEVHAWNHGVVNILGVVEREEGKKVNLKKQRLRLEGPNGAWNLLQKWFRKLSTANFQKKSSGNEGGMTIAGKK